MPSYLFLTPLRKQQRKLSPDLSTRTVTGDRTKLGVTDCRGFAKGGPMIAAGLSALDGAAFVNLERGKIMADYETEITRTIWNNKHGTKIVVKPDADGGLVEITQDHKETITLTIEEARLLAPALLATATEIDAAA